MKSLPPIILYSISLLMVGLPRLTAAQEAVPTPTATVLGPANGAIVPTASGEIGVNPVSMLPDADIFRGTVLPDEAQATDGAFFAVATNAAGDLDITIVDPDLRDFLSRVAEEAPVCSVSKRHLFGRQLVRRRQFCGPRYVVDEFEREFQNAKDVMESLDGEIRDIIPEHPVVQEVERLLVEAEISGGEEVVVEVALSIMGEGEVVAMQAGVGSGLGILGVGFLTYVYHVFEADRAAAEVAGTKPSVLGIHVPSNSIQIAAETVPTETASETSTSTGSCPTETELACGGDDCEMQRLYEGDANVVCEGKYDGCECATEFLYIAAVVTLEEDTAMQFFSGKPPDSIASPPALSGSADCEDNHQTVEKKDWYNLVETLCAEHYDLRESFQQSYQPSDIFTTAYDKLTFNFEWIANSDADCENPCSQIFREGFVSTACSYDSHTMAASGSYKLACGEAKYEIKDQDARSPGPQCGSDDPSNIPNKAWDDGAGNAYGAFCNAVTSGEDLRRRAFVSGDEGSDGKRAPEPGQSSDFSIELIWETGKGAAADRKCEKSCEDVMREFATSDCGQQGSPAVYMSKSASYDVGCGTYSYVMKHAQPLALQEQQCFSRDEFGPHEDVQWEWVREYAAYTCTGSANRTIRRGQGDSFAVFYTVTNRVRYELSAKWDARCELTDGIEEVNLWKPLGDSEVDCLSLFHGNYKNCDNGGIGGHIQAGCVVFEFKATSG